MKQLNTNFNEAILREKDYWQINQNNNQLNILDIIKGLVPNDLVKTLLIYVNKEKKIQSILIEALNTMNNLIRDQIWKKRCSKTVEIELQFGINKRNKRKANNSNTINNNNINNNSINTDNNHSNKINKNKKIPSENWKIWMVNNIKYGQNIQLM